jgi:hypothetical protein
MEPRWARGAAPRPLERIDRCRQVATCLIYISPGLRGLKPIISHRARPVRNWSGALHWPSACPGGAEATRTRTGVQVVRPTSFLLSFASSELDGFSYCIKLCVVGEGCGPAPAGESILVVVSSCHFLCALRSLLQLQGRSHMLSLCSICFQIVALCGDLSLRVSVAIPFPSMMYFTIVFVFLFLLFLLH